MFVHNCRRFGNQILSNYCKVHERVSTFSSSEKLVVSIVYFIRLFGYLRCIGFYLCGESGTLRLVRGKKSQVGWA